MSIKSCKAECIKWSYSIDFSTFESYLKSYSCDQDAKTAIFLILITDLLFFLSQYSVFIYFNGEEIPDSPIQIDYNDKNKFAIITDISKIEKNELGQLLRLYFKINFMTVLKAVYWS